MGTPTVQLTLDRAVFARLRTMARRRGVEPQEALRLLIDDAEGRASVSAHDRAPHLCGSVDVPYTDVSANLDHYLDGLGE